MEDGHIVKSIIKDTGRKYSDYSTDRVSFGFNLCQSTPLVKNVFVY